MKTGFFPMRQLEMPGTTRVFCDSTTTGSYLPRVAVGHALVLAYGLAGVTSQP